MTMKKLLLNSLVAASVLFAVVSASDSGALAGLESRGGAAHALGRPGKPTPLEGRCDPEARGPDLAQRQQAAGADFFDILLRRHDVQTAFDKYIPGTYIQHNPTAQQGRAFAIPFIQGLFAPPAASSNITVFSGQGYVFAHHKYVQPDGRAVYAIMDYFRFQGTCLVEHWDVMQEITGDEPNPLAYF
ncbi:hypothetical protein FA15DRAFT_645902 [Coprinopsis marcescibilis]|uniref:SnoaL-like domain-containing protein n=1 Tax=Coprinopsis marcescibilis TaxID=230819 RepID=A0A5C3KLH8_COPMA|nr:hypothetical protein FA15DRAFT_645902 [Coprinopsis marcescibilis]